MTKIAVFDPSLKDNSGNPSINLGDLIIYESVSKYLRELIPDCELVRISSHSVPGNKLLRRASQAELIFFGGTNALSSDIRTYHQWKIKVPPAWLWRYSFPVEEVILLGVGWWQYQEAPTALTEKFYKKVLSSKWMHSVRDAYTLEKLQKMGFSNVLNTSCPTMWELNGMDVSLRRGQSTDCLFTLTDYNPAPVYDETIIELLSEAYSGTLYFFPQGTLDIGYIQRLRSYKKHADRITILDRTFESYVSCLQRQNIDYVGTRLHAGIKALQLKKNCLILAVDNRATEIANDTGLPVVQRSEPERLKQWLQGEKLFETIRLPMDNIDQWKLQFKR